MNNEQYSHMLTGDEAMHNQRLILNKLESDKSPITYDEYLENQEKIILSEENKEKATSAIGHKPTRNELAQYYVDSGQAAKFHKENFYRVIPKKAS